jgi:bacteriocin biosynthesis cyclodehydratase domain-containing protein
MKMAYRRPAAVNGICVDTGILRDLASLADGSREIEDIVGALIAAGHAPDAISSAFDALDESDGLRETPISSLSEEESARYAGQMRALAAIAPNPRRWDINADWKALGEPLQASLKSSLVLVAGLGTLGTQVIRNLALAGVGRIAGLRDSAECIVEHGAWCRPEDLPATVHALNPFSACALMESTEQPLPWQADPNPNLLIYCPDLFDEDVCHSLNLFSLSTGIPLLPARRSAFDIEIGPLVVPGSTACYTCAILRRNSAMGRWGSFDAQIGEGMLNFPMAAGWIVLEAIKFLVCIIEPASRNRIVRLDYINATQRTHPVLKLPRCPDCGVHRITPQKKLWEEVRETS